MNKQLLQRRAVGVTPEKPVLRKQRRVALAAERHARRRKISTTSGPSRSERSARAAALPLNRGASLIVVLVLCRSGCGRQPAALSLRWLRLCWDNRAPERGSQSRYAARCRGYQRGPIHAGLRRTSLAPIAGPTALFNLALQSAIALVIGRSSALAGNSPRWPVSGHRTPRPRFHALGGSLAQSARVYGSSEDALSSIAPWGRTLLDAPSLACSSARLVEADEQSLHAGHSIFLTD